MSSIRTAPCDWPALDCRDCTSLAELEDVVVGEGEGEDEGRTLAELVLEAATGYLWNWTGKRFGLCEVEVRPCRQDCPTDWSTYYGPGTRDRFVPSTGAWPFHPAQVGGVWRNLTCGACGDQCSCEHVSAIRLPGPVDSIVEVLIDGEVLDPAAYRVDDRRTLIRQDGADWPRCQDLSAPSGEPGTWSVRYRWGVPVPVGGQIAAGVLACEMAKALCGSNDCGLPQRITQSVTREGLSVAVFDPFDTLESGRTGLWLVDSWVASITHAPQRSTVTVPRARRPSVTTFGGGA
jgi:hypothetical protein